MRLGCCLLWLEIRTDRLKHLSRMHFALKRQNHYIIFNCANPFCPMLQISPNNLFLFSLSHTFSIIVYFHFLSLSVFDSIWNWKSMRNMQSWNSWEALINWLNSNVSRPFRALINKWTKIFVWWNKSNSKIPNHIKLCFIVGFIAGALNPFQYFIVWNGTFTFLASSNVNVNKILREHCNKFE